MLSKKTKARIIRTLVILGVLLVLAVTGVIIAVNQLLAGRVAQNSMPEDGVIYLYEQADGTTRMEWTAGINADNYTVEVTRSGSSQVLFSLTTEKRSCTLPQLPKEDILVIRVRSGALYRGKTYPGSRDLSVTLKLTPPTVSDLQWQVDPDTDILRMQAVTGVDTACRFRVTDMGGNTGNYQEMLSGKATVVFGNRHEYPVPGKEDSYTLAVTAYRQASSMIYYGIQEKTVTLTREQFLGSVVKLDYETSEQNTATLTWNETTGDYYELQRLSDDGQSWQTVYTVPRNGELKFTTEQLDGFRKYRFRVVSVTNSEDGEPQRVISAELRVSTGVSSQYATVWPLVELPVYSDAERTAAIGSVLAGKAYCVLAEVGGSFQIRYNNDIGYLDSNYCLINLPEYIGDMVSYDITNSYASVFKIHGYSIAAVTQTVLLGYENVEQKNGQFLVPLLYPTAKKLVAAAQAARKEGYRLKIYEAYRPRETTLSIYELTSRIINSKVPLQSMTYQQLMTDNGRYALSNFLANGISNHNRGVALDLTLETLDGKEVEMQTDMHDLSWYSEVSANNTAASLLRKIMTGSGFAPLRSEWWHFQDDEIKAALSLQPMQEGVSARCWVRSDYGWRYRLEDGTYLCGTTRSVDGVSYIFDANGYATLNSPQGQ